VHGIENVDYGTTLFVKKRKQDDNGMLSCAGMYKMKAFFFFFFFFLTIREVLVTTKGNGWINIGDRTRVVLNDVRNKICKLGIIIYFGRYITFEG
jgi:hypothetical protein